MPLNQYKSPNSKTVETKQSQLTVIKKIAFSLVLVGIFIILLVFLEVGLRIADYGGNSRLFETAPDESSKFYRINLNIGQRYFYYFGEGYDPKPKKDMFLKIKPGNGYRIFVLGASTTAGFPFGDNVTFPRILQRYLMETFPTKHIEVVNTAITSLNSYALLDFMDEILQQSPDVILIYAGHNEFYGPFGPAAKVSLGNHRKMVRLLLGLQRYKSYILFRNVIGSGFRKMINSPESGQQVDAEFKAKTYIPLGSRQYQAGLDQFEENMEGIIRKCQKAEVSLVLSDLVSNIRDRKPFDSISADSLPMAGAVFQEARSLENEGKYAEARKMYLKAKDLDPVRFRAPEAFNDIIHHLGEKYRLPVVPMFDYFSKVSPHGLIGNNIILEHVHPTYAGYFLMAEAFYKTMYQTGMVDAQWSNYIENPAADFMPRWGYTELDQIYAGLVTENLKSGWPFVKDKFSTITGSYLLNHFTPQNKLDSIALAACTDAKYSIQVGHLDLGEFYEKNGDFDRALAEYKSLIYIIPTMDMVYENALNLLLKTQNYEKANQLMQDAVKFSQSAYIYKWLGQTYLPLNKLREGLTYLTCSFELDSKDRQVLFNLVRAYYGVSDISNGDKYLRIYQESFPNDPGIEQLKKFRQSLQ